MLLKKSEGSICVKKVKYDTMQISAEISQVRVEKNVIYIMPIHKEIEKSKVI